MVLSDSVSGFVGVSGNQMSGSFPKGERTLPFESHTNVAFSP